MAVTAETRKDIIELVVTALNEAPGTKLLNELVAIADANGNGVLDEVAAHLAASDAFTAKYPAFQTAEEFAAKWLSNLIPEASSETLTEATAVVVGLVNGGSSPAALLLEAQTFLSAAAETDASFGTSAANFNNKVEVATHHTVTLLLAEPSTSAIASVTSDDATVEAGKDALGGGASAGGATFTATTGTDTVVGTAGNDVINAPAGTLNAGDTIDGSDGTDTLNVTWTGTGPAQSASTLKNVEVINLTASPNPASLALTGVTGITDINNSGSANGATVTVSDVGNAVNSTLTGGQASTTIGYTTAVTASTATSDKSTLTLAGTNLGASYTATGIEEVTVNSTKSANTLSSLGVSSATKVTVTGDQALTINGTVGGSALASVDASAFTGTTLSMTAGAGVGKTAEAGVAVTLPTADTVTSTITTGSNKDTITLGAGGATVTAGGGDDTITSGAGTNTIMGGGGNDSIKLSGTKDTLRYDETGSSNADTIEGFSSSTVIAVNLGTAKTSIANASPSSDFGVVQTGATSPTIGNVDGKGTDTAIVFQTVSPTATTTSGAVAAGSNVLALNGAFTDGTAAGVVTALGTSATTAIATATGSKFLVVTYSVGNIAQVWSYNGDDDADTDIDASELALVATLSGVTQNSITAANFATYLTTSAAAGTVSNSGQTITVNTPKTLIQSEANTAGQFLTAADDTINVGTGMLPTGTATATMGLTVIDPAGTGDNDTLNAQVLAEDWDQGTLLSNVETVNLEFLTADTNGFAMSSVMPGTDTLNISGLANVSDIHGVISGTSFGIGSAYTGTVELDAGGAAIASATLILNGSNKTTAAASATFDTDSAGGDKITALTVDVKANSSINLDLDKDDDFAGITLKGAGSVNIFAAAAEIADANITAPDLTYTGTFTLTSDGASTAFDFTDTGSDIVGLDVLNFSASAGANTITLPAVTGGGNFTVSHNPAATANMGGTVTVTQSGSATADKLTVAFGSKSTGLGAGNDIVGTAGTEQIVITSAAAKTVTTTINDISTTAPGTDSQTVTISGAGIFAINDINADTVNATGVGKALTINSLTNTVGTTTLTVGNGGVTITASGTNTITNVTSGSGADTIRTGSGDDVINVGDGANTVISGAGADTITGGSGVDNITAGGGNDSITTGGGADVIILDQITANNQSNVKDFTSGTDNFQISKATFDGAVAGTPFVVADDLATARFTSVANAAALTGGTVAGATDAEEIIHLKDTGAIYLNTNGATGGGLVLIGSVQAGSTLAATDFIVVT